MPATHQFGLLPGARSGNPSTTTYFCQSQFLHFLLQLLTFGSQILMTGICISYLTSLMTMQFRQFPLLVQYPVTSMTSLGGNPPRQVFAPPKKSTSTSQQRTPSSSHNRAQEVSFPMPANFSAAPGQARTYHL